MLGHGYHSRSCSGSLRYGDVRQRDRKGLADVQRCPLGSQCTLSRQVFRGLVLIGSSWSPGASLTKPIFLLIS